MRKKILIAFFIMIITSQLYGLAFAPHNALNEKRNLATLPEFKIQRLLKKQYFSKLGHFLDDRYPYRSPLIIMNNWIDYHAFKTSPTSPSSPKVHIGIDKWFYLKNGIKDYFKDECQKRAKAQSLARELNYIEKELESSGKKFYFIVAPDKATIYPEYVGKMPSPEACGKGFYDLFLEALEDYPLRGFIRLDKDLLLAKKDFQLYYKRGTHWNDRGAALVSKIILKKLSTAEEEFRLQDIKFKKGVVTRDLAAMFALALKENSDNAININKNRRIKSRNLKLLPNGNSHLNITTEAEPGFALLPRTVMYRDSFMTVPLLMIEGSFQEMDALWSRKIPVAPNIDTRVLKESRILIIEVVQRNLFKLQIKEKALLKDIGTEPSDKRDEHKL